jgi:hypothetical protein
VKWLTDMPTEQLVQLLENAGQVPDNIRGLMCEAARRLREAEDRLKEARK